MIIVRQERHNKARRERKDEKIRVAEMKLLEWNLHFFNGNEREYGWPGFAVTDFFFVAATAAKQRSLPYLVFLL